MKLDRRTVLMQGAAAFALTLPGTQALAATRRNRIVTPILRRKIVTRPNIHSLALNDADLQAYRDAVKAMKALPASDARNWTKQAEIHNNFCPHRNWFFLPWHRAYLVAFERICRQLS